MKKLTVLLCLLLTALSLQANDAAIKALIEKNSDVVVEIINDSINPWTIVNDTLYCSAWLSTLTIIYESDSITQIDVIDPQYGIGQDINVNGKQRESGSYIPAGKNKIRLSCSSSGSVSIAIKKVCAADIQTMIEANSDVEVEIINDSINPWIIFGQDTLGQYEPNSKFSIRFSSEKTTSFNFDKFGSNYIEILYIDDVEYPAGIGYDNQAEPQYHYLPAGTHTITFVSHTYTAPQYPAKLIGISIREIDDAMEPMILRLDRSMTNIYHKHYYDYTGTGLLQNGFMIDLVDGSIKGGPSETFQNLNNDDYIDATWNKTDSKGAVISHGHSFAEYTEHELTKDRDGSTGLDVLDYNNDGYPDLANMFILSREVKDKHQKIVNTIYNSGIVQAFVNVYSLNAYKQEHSNTTNTELENTTIQAYKKPQRVVRQDLNSALNGMSIVSNLSGLQSALTREQPAHMSIDVNGDGVVDYVQQNYTASQSGNSSGSVSVHKNQTIFLNMGKGDFIRQEISGNFIDLNADGIMDVIGYDGTDAVYYLLQSDGTYQKHQFGVGARHNEVWCYDFDKDGDKDILLAYNYNTSWNGSYLIMLENIGNGEYNYNEFFYTDRLYNPMCIDYDNDGYYELIWKIDSDNDGKQDDFCHMDVNGMQISEIPIYWNISDNLELNNFNVIDTDNDGILELWAPRDYSVKIDYLSYSVKDILYMKLSTTANAKPDTPKAPKVVYDHSVEQVAISWDLGSDKETSPVDLTYALRIGTETGKGDIVYAHAHPDGTRRNLIGGNMSTNRYRVLNTNTWKPGKYYVSIQAIDPNNRGSEFSEEVIFEKKSHVASFELMYNSEFFGTGDTCTIFLHPNVLLDTTHYIGCSNGEIVAVSEDSLTMYAVFSKAGEQTISLYSQNSNGATVATCEKIISVAPFHLSNLKTRNVRVALDLDEDGYMEFYGDYHGETTTSHFHTFAADGSISRINKMFNNNTAWDEYGAPFVTVDINKDGKVDVFAGTPYYGNGFKAINTGNGSMSLNTTDLISSHYPVIDFNNDGWFDDEHDRTTGYYSSPEYKSFHYWSSPYASMVKDFTNDGLVDILEYKATYCILYENNGDFTFTLRDTLWIDTCNLTFCEQLIYVGDFDNDGKYDIVYDHSEDVNTGYETLEINYHGIHWGDGTNTAFDDAYRINDYGQFYRGSDRQGQTIFFDYDNNGYLDLLAQKECPEGTILGVLLMQPNHSYQFIATGYIEAWFDAGNKAYRTPQGNLAFTGENINTILHRPNTQPAAPTNLTATQSKKGVMITWDHSQDAETPAVRMRYNISVKHKGKTGEGAYLISPCNSTKNGVPVPSHLPLIEGNRFMIPTASIPAGEYEVQVQGVDLHQWQSDFSEVYNLIVKETIAIEAPATTGVGVETTVSIASNVSTNIDWDGGNVIDTIGNQYIVVWDSIGLRTITAGEDTHLINVKPLPDATFTLPEQVMQLATVQIDAHNVREGKWAISVNSGKTFVPCTESDVIDILSVDTANAVLRFNKAGKYIVRRTIAGEFGDGVCEQVTIVNSEHIAPEITAVTNIGGKYQIIWEQSAAMPAEVIGYRLYKESTSTDVYQLVAENIVDSTMFVDLSSNPDVQSSRYALSYVTTYGESTKGTPHQGLHVMINRGVGTTWNLAWMKYEGRQVNQYRIWRGTTPDSLVVIGEISGNMTSYSDLMTGDSINYYAIEVIFIDNTPSSLPTRRLAPRSSGISAMSNIISTTSVNEVAFVEHIDVQGEDIVAGISNTSQLYAYIQPYYASYKAVNWVITEGEDIAKISASGLLSVNGYTNGDVVVRAYALDGSNVYGETTINVRGFDDTFTITYMVDGEVIKTEKLSYGSAIVAPESDKEGYHIVWYDLPDIMPANNIMVEGSYVINSYKITYIVDSEVYASDSLLYGATIELLPEPTKEGYTFSGWNDVPSTMPAHDVVVNGVFTINSYDVIYMVDGAEYKRVSVVYGAPIVLEAEPTKEGYTFSGWSDVPKTMPTHDVVVEGSFTINKYLLTYMVEGNVFATDSIVYGAPIELIAGPEKEGYTFAWDHAPSTMPAHDVVVNGVFTINSYDVIYMVDGAEYKRVSVVYGAPIVLEAEPSKEGYTFSGWSDVPETMPAHDVVVEGSFIVNYYALTYMVDDEWYATDSIAYGDVIELREEPTKEGYIFSGWSEVQETMPAHDVEVLGTFTLITSVNNVTGNGDGNVQKIIKDDQLLIFSNEKTYTVMGVEL